MRDYNLFVIFTNNNLKFITMEAPVKKLGEKVKGKRGRKPRQTPVEAIVTMIHKLESFEDLDKLVEEIVNIRNGKKQAEIERLKAQLAKLEA